MKRKKIMCIPTVFLLALMTCCAEQRAADSSGENVPQAAMQSQTEAEGTETPQSSVSEETGDVNRNPLTGETDYPAEAVEKRPVAVMVNNLKASYPQRGIGQADVLYEIPVEGGVTRMMAVFADPSDVPDVGSVRSARYYFPEIAAGMDAVLCHWGAEQIHAVNTMEALLLDRFDGGDPLYPALFYRDAQRAGVYSSEHTGFLRGAEIPAAFEATGVRQHAVSRKTAFSFADEQRMPEGFSCTYVNVPFSDSSSTGFTYDAQSQKYLADHNGQPQMDSGTDEQLSFTNIFVLQTEIGYLDETEYLRRVELDSGSGYFISAGGAQSIRWEKDDAKSPIEYYAADGTELTVNVGNSYIGIIGEECEFVFTGE